jgi:hypothetical protein
MGDTVNIAVRLMSQAPLDGTHPCTLGISLFIISPYVSVVFTFLTFYMHLVPLSFTICACADNAGVLTDEQTYLAAMAANNTALTFDMLDHELELKGVCVCCTAYKYSRLP